MGHKQEELMGQLRVVQVELCRDVTELIKQCEKLKESSERMDKMLAQYRKK